MADDHQAARVLGEAAAQHPDVERVAPVETNIVIFTLRDGLLAQDFVDDVAKQGLLCFPFGPKAVRLVTHLDVDHEAIHRAVEIIGAWRPSTAQSTT
jgi:threonine aldolase